MLRATKREEETEKGKKLNKQTNVETILLFAKYKCTPVARARPEAKKTKPLCAVSLSLFRVPHFFLPTKIRMSSIVIVVVVSVSPIPHAQP